MGIWNDYTDGVLRKAKQLDGERKDLSLLTEKRACPHWDMPLVGVLRKNATQGNPNAAAQSNVSASWNAQAQPRQSTGAGKGDGDAAKPKAEQSAARAGDGKAGAPANARGEGNKPTTQAQTARAPMQTQAPVQAQPQPQTLPNVFRMFADESGTKQNHETWVAAARAHGGFDDLNARILARPLSALQIGAEKQQLVMRRAKELHAQVSGGDKTHTAFDTWARLKAELPFILGVEVGEGKVARGEKK